MIRKGLASYPIPSAAATTPAPERELQLGQTFGLVYDPEIERVVLINGAQESGSAKPTELWTWDGTTWTHPDGGFYVWVTLPEGFDAAAMLPRAVTARVAYVPGTAFYADGLGSRQLRLSYCFPTSERIVEGVRRLATVLESELDVMRTFGTSWSRPALGPSSPSPDTA